MERAVHTGLGAQIVANGARLGALGVGGQIVAVGVRPSALTLAVLVAAEPRLAVLGASEPFGKSAFSQLETWGARWRPSAVEPAADKWRSSFSQLTAAA